MQWGQIAMWGGMALALFAGTPVPAQTNALYVAPTGSDNNPGSLAQPYQTIQRCAGSAPSGWSCVIRAGSYRETVTPNSGITLTAYPGETVTLDGTDPVSGSWQVYSGNIYKISAKLGLADGNQLFVGQQMMTLARWPNGSDLLHPNWATAQAGTNLTTLVDPVLPNLNWVGAQLLIWSGTDPYQPLTAKVTAASAGNLTFTLLNAPQPDNILPMAGGFYYLYNSLLALDQPGEWYYDATGQTLYFQAPKNVNPSTLDVRAKSRTIAIDLSGKSNVTVKNLTLFATTIFSDPNSSGNVIDGITATYMSHFSQFPDQPNGSGGFYLHSTDSGIVLDGSNNILRNSSLAFSAGNGVSLLGFQNTVQNNLIHDFAYSGTNCAGITLIGNNHVIKNNTIYNSGRMNIFFGKFTGNAFHNIDVSYNNVSASSFLSRDTGSLYAGGQPSMVNVNVHHNWFHDSLYAAGPPSVAFNTLPNSGIYIDDDNSGMNAYQNVLWNNANVDIDVHGNGATANQPMSVQIHNNTVLDLFTVGSFSGNIVLFQIANCGTTRIFNNRILVPVDQEQTLCAAFNNGPTAPGATEMTSSVAVGCNFAGCATNPPPTYVNGVLSVSIATQPYGVQVFAGNPASFSVIATGTAPISYQWLRNGVAIAGANSATYSLTATTGADDGAVFSVTVSNSAGSLTSNGATLSVQ